MRLLLVMILIALLPLRGWTASAMLADHETRSVTSKTVAASAYSTMAAARFDAQTWPLPANCPEHAAQSSTAADQDHTHKRSNTSAACDACGLCHLSVATCDLPPVPEVTALAKLPTAIASLFASVITPPGLKPPIA